MSRKRDDTVSASVSASKEAAEGIDLALAGRMAKLIGLFEPHENVERIAKRSDEALRKYAKGKTRVAFEPAARLALAKGVSLEWLATGEEPMLLAERPEPAPALSGTEEIDQLAGAIFFAVRKAYRGMEMPLDDDELFDQARRAYAKTARPGLSEAERIGIAKGFGYDLADELAARKAAISKRSA